MTVLINAANILSVLGYFTSDMLRLRLLSIVATTCGLIYFYGQPEPLMTMVAWNLVFLALNAVQLARMLRPRWPRISLGGRQAALP